MKMFNFCRSSCERGVKLVASKNVFRTSKLFINLLYSGNNRSIEWAERREFFERVCRKWKQSLANVQNAYRAFFSKALAIFVLAIFSMGLRIDSTLFTRVNINWVFFYSGFRATLRILRNFFFRNRLVRPRKCCECRKRRRLFRGHRLVLSRSWQVSTLHSNGRNSRISFQRRMFSEVNQSRFEEKNKSSRLWNSSKFPS